MSMLTQKKLKALLKCHAFPILKVNVIINYILYVGYSSKASHQFLLFLYLNLLNVLCKINATGFLASGFSSDIPKLH